MHFAAARKRTFRRKERFRQAGRAKGKLRLALCRGEESTFRRKEEMNAMEIDKHTIDTLLLRAAENPRRRQNLDLRTTPADKSQRMLNALLPGTEVAVHRHVDTSETVVCLYGRLDEVFYEEVDPLGGDAASVLSAEKDTAPTRFREVGRVSLCPAEGKYGCQIPKGVWHAVEVFEPSVIFEAKDGAYKG